jgi:hypothetical protein
MRMLQTFRFDASDEQVFARAAAPGEWAVPGAFTFAAIAPAEITGKRAQAFRSGFLGLASFGWASFAVIVEIDEATLMALTDRLARHLVERHGAPDLAAARPAAAEELAFARSLCEQPVNTLLVVERALDAAGDIRESFRTVQRPRTPVHARIWELVAEVRDEQP